MLISKATGTACVILSLLSATVCAQPALAQDHRQLQFEETRRAAFAGASFRVELGRSQRPPAARLQLGVRAISTGRQAEAATRIAHAPVFEVGLAGRESGNLFIAGQPASAFQQRLLGGPGGTTVAVIFGVALLAVTVLVVTSLDDLDL